MNYPYCQHYCAHYGDCAVVVLTFKAWERVNGREHPMVAGFNSMECPEFESRPTWQFDCPGQST